MCPSALTSTSCTVSLLPREALATFATNSRTGSWPKNGDCTQPSGVNNAPAFSTSPASNAWRYLRTACCIDASDTEMQDASGRLGLPCSRSIQLRLVVSGDDSHAVIALIHHVRDIFRRIHVADGSRAGHRPLGHGHRLARVHLIGLGLAGAGGK